MQRSPGFRSWRRSARLPLGCSRETWRSQDRLPTRYRCAIGRDQIPPHRWRRARQSRAWPCPTGGQAPSSRAQGRRSRPRRKHQRTSVFLSGEPVVEGLVSLLTTKWMLSCIRPSICLQPLNQWNLFLYFPEFILSSLANRCRNCLAFELGKLADNLIGRTVPDRKCHVHTPPHIRIYVT